MTQHKKITTQVEFTPAEGFNPYQTGYLHFPMEAYADGLLDGVLITQPSYEAEGCKIGLSLATDPQMRVIGADERIPSYTIAWPNFIRTFTEVPYGT